MLAVAVWWRAGKLTLTRTERASTAELLSQFKDSIWGLVLLVIIMGGIYGGIFTPTEAAAVSAVYAIFVAVVHLPRHQPRARCPRSSWTPARRR